MKPTRDRTGRPVLPTRPVPGQQVAACRDHVEVNHA
jgi:hypothetical protein